MVDLCIYHANCNDGFTAAWAVKKRYREVELLAANYDDKPPYVEGRDVAIVDFSYPYEVMADMARVADSILVLDHHKSAYEAIKKLNEEFDNVEVNFDLEKSGAALTWEWFHGTSTQLPMLIALVQDRDLWRFEYPGTKQLHAYLTSQPYDLRIWNEVHEELESKNLQAPLFMVGGGIMRMQTHQIKELIKLSAFRGRFAGETVWCLDCPKVWQSEAGNIMASKPGEPFAVLFATSEHKVQFSLRSVPDGMDVAEIAQRFDGGGHKHAAGFNVFRNPNDLTFQTAAFNDGRDIVYVQI